MLQHNAIHRIPQHTDSLTVLYLYIHCHNLTDVTCSQCKTAHCHKSTCKQFSPSSILYNITSARKHGLAWKHPSPVYMYHTYMYACIMFVCLKHLLASLQQTHLHTRHTTCTESLHHPRHITDPSTPLNLSQPHHNQQSVNC